MEIDILSLFPDYFLSPLNVSILKKAVERGILRVRSHNIREFGLGKWKQVDDVPYSGGGMLLAAEPVAQAIRNVRRPSSKVVYLSPQGALLTAAKSRELASCPHLILLCGHYEGIDERAIESEVDEEISIGDYVLTNGCLAALVVLDSLSRFIPGVLGNEDSADKDSLENGLLEGPQYTRPRVFEGKAVPEVLLQGDHKKIVQWRLQRSLERTAERRPDLYARYLFQDMGNHFELEDSSLISSKCAGVVLEVENASKAKKFYSKLFRLEKIEGEILNLPGKAPQLQLLEIGTKTRNKATLFLQLEDESEFISFAKRWKMLGGTLDSHFAEGGTAGFARDLDGHKWALSYSVKSTR